MPISLLKSKTSKKNSRVWWCKGRFYDVEILRTDGPVAQIIVEGQKETKGWTPQSRLFKTEKEGIHRIVNTNWKYDELEDIEWTQVLG